MLLNIMAYCIEIPARGLGLLHAFRIYMSSYTPVNFLDLVCRERMSGCSESKISLEAVKHVMELYVWAIVLHPDDLL